MLHEHIVSVVVILSYYYFISYDIIRITHLQCVTAKQAHQALAQSRNVLRVADSYKS